MIDGYDIRKYQEQQRKQYQEQRFVQLQAENAELTKRIEFYQAMISVYEEICGKYQTVLSHIRNNFNL